MKTAMMNKSRSLLLLSVLSVLFAACEEGIIDNAILSQDYSEPEYSITVSPSELSFPAEGGEEKVMLELSQSLSWTATTNAPWITLSDNSGTENPSPFIHVVVAENTSVESRTGTVTFKTREKTATLTVTQDATQPVLAANVNVLTFPFGGGSQEISITSNARWTVVNPSSWLSLSADSGTGDATLTVTAAENSTTFFRQGTLTLNYGGGPVSIAFLQHATPDLNGHAYVDLALPSGLLWATCNVGATMPEEYGDYFAWGETAKKNSYTWANYKWSDGSMQSLTKYNNRNDYGIVDNLSELLPSDDAAVVNWGGCWRMPTYAEWEELCNTDNCTWTPLHNNGHCEGYKVTSTRNGNSIFLPAAGLYTESGLDHAGLSGYFWASTLFSAPDQGCGLYFDDAGHPHAFSRYQGLSVRPVGKMTLHFSLSPTSVNLPASGSSETLSITANQPWTVTTSDAWLTLSADAGTGDATLDVAAEENTSITRRTGAVTFQTGATTYTVTISQEGATPTFNVSPESLSFTAEGGSASVTISSNQSWTATTSDAWFSISSAEGEGDATLSLTVVANTSTDSRSGTVTLKAGDSSYTVSVSQEGEDPILTISPESLSFSADGGNKSITVTSNLSWTATSSDAWLTLSNSSGEGDATLTVMAQENPSTSSRTASVTFKGKDITFTVIVTQEGASPAFSVTPTTLSFTSSGGSQSVSIKSNQTWTASFDVSWLSLSTASGTGDATVSITAQANTYTDNRAGTVTFTSGGKTYTVTVIQDGAAIHFEITPTTITFTAKGGSKSVSVMSNQPWTVSSDVSWLKLSNSSGTSDATLSVTAEENTSTSSRAGTVTFSAGDRNYTVSITQEGADPFFNIAPETLSFASSGESKSVSITSNISWTASSSVSWLTLSKTSGTGDASVSVSAQANTSTDNRSGIVTFTAGGKTYTVSVTQEGVPTYFEVSPTTLSFSASGGSKSISVMSNQPWTVSSDASWLTLSDNSGTGDATLSVTAEENTSTSSRSGTVTFSAGGRDYTISVTQEAAEQHYEEIDGHAFVDLALPSGTFWAACNLGASSPEEFGNYFAWGETKAKNDYSWTTYKWCNGSYYTLTKYNTLSNYGSVDNKTVLDLKDDAASANWGGGWYMPDKEWDEILNTDNCTWTWTTLNGVNGHKVTSKRNGNFIFLPAAGWRIGTEFANAGTSGYYWPSSLDEDYPHNAPEVYFSLADVGRGSLNRNYGLSIRPVYQPNPTFSVTPTTLSFTSSGGNQSISLKANQPWTASSNVSWLTLSKTSGTGDATLTITAQANTSTSSRSGLITFNYLGSSFSVFLMQAGVEMNKIYLTFEALEDTRFNFSSSNLQFSLDGGSTWTKLIAGTPTIRTGEKIMWKGSAFPDDIYGIGTFISTGKFNAEGNIMSLLYGDIFAEQTSLDGYDYAFARLFSESMIVNAENLTLPATTLAFYCYREMFNSCTSLTIAPALPATTLAGGCYQSMFYGCTGLSTAPTLPATTLANYCYASMFEKCTGLTTAPALPATTLAESCYTQMFYGCTSLTRAPALPATTLAFFCYQGMFWGCNSLTIAPSLPATITTQYCYSNMFRGCTSLATAPELPATTLADNCYSEMFYGCSNLTKAPVLPATTLAGWCYQNMFYGCTNLNYIKCLATNVSTYNCSYHWVDGVSSSGTFVKNASMTRWTTGTSGIPSGWTVQDAN